MSLSQKEKTLMELIAPNPRIVMTEITVIPILILFQSLWKGLGIVFLYKICSKSPILIEANKEDQIGLNMSPIKLFSLLISTRMIFMRFCEHYIHHEATFETFLRSFDLAGR